ncbi:hypothetical protein D3C71_2151310 [compost metagenome]
MDFLGRLAVHYVQDGDYPGDPRLHAAALLNMNTPEDYSEALGLVSLLPVVSSEP